MVQKLNVKKMISVAMCTYNGAKHIDEQVRSILSQTVPVDEIVVCDDWSADDTVQIIENIREEVDANIRVFVNETNFGVCANFQKAVDMCKGDIIFLADQDDVWYPHKVKTVVEWFEKHPDKSVVFTNADLIDGEGNYFSVDKTLWDYFFTSPDRIMFEKGLELECMIRNYHVTGATMAMKKSFLENHSFLQFTDNEKILHDLVIAIKSVEEKGLGFIDKELIKYRIHQNQIAGIPNGLYAEYNNDWRSPFYPSQILCSLLVNQGNVDRANFLNWRIWTKHRICGMVYIVLAFPRYFSFYGSRGLGLAVYDTKISIEHSWNRVRQWFVRHWK